jgi:hypothetical protein
MGRLLDDIYSNIPGTTVILSTLIVSKNGLTERFRANVNAQFRALVQDRRGNHNQKIVLAEMDGSKPFFTTNDIGDNDVHPNDGGYLKMAAVFYRALESAEAAGFLNAPNPTDVVNDDKPGQTCPKVYGVSRGPVNTQAGSGLDDGIYIHNSQDKGVAFELITGKPESFWFARIVPSGVTEDQLVQALGQTGDNEVTYRAYSTLGEPGTWNKDYYIDFTVPDLCIPRGVRWADINGKSRPLCLIENTTNH